MMYIISSYLPIVLTKKYKNGQDYLQFGVQPEKEPEQKGNSLSASRGLLEQKEEIFLDQSLPAPRPMGQEKAAGQESSQCRGIESTGL